MSLPSLFQSWTGLFNCLASIPQIEGGRRAALRNYN
jgi:hypothetical protein